MSTPMYDLPEHFKLGVTKDGRGPATPSEPDFAGYACWCGDPACELYGELLVTRFINSTGDFQLVTDGPDAKCPTCGYPERHRIYTLEGTLTADGCPSCETARSEVGDAAADAEG